MDTVTQITLGAAVGEAVLGKKIGSKGAAWGAAFGVLPDLDVLANPFVSEVQEIIIHRGISHSLFFSVVAAPVFGWMLYRRYKDKPASWRDWSVMVFLVILTHIFIDACTGYGTQVFQPFSNYSLSFNTIFIIDPFYTLPLLIGIVTALFFRQSSTRRWVNYIGIVLSSIYMLAGFGFKSHVNTVFEQNFEQQQLSVDRFMTTPMPLTQFLWVGYAISGDEIYTGLYSIFDADESIAFQKLEMNRELIQPYEDQLPVERILWFSHGYFIAEKGEDHVSMHDLRFGRSDLWLSTEPAPMVWTYNLRFNEDSTRVTGFNHQEPSFEFTGERFGKLIDRITGS